jgi:hypothetical protein
MLVELYIHGQLYRTWEFDRADYHEPYCLVGIEEKERLWAQIIEKCKAEVGLVIYSPHTFCFIMPARIQPADVDPEEYEKFLLQIIENEQSIMKNQNNSLWKKK